MRAATEKNESLQTHSDGPFRWAARRVRAPLPPKRNAHAAAAQHLTYTFSARRSGGAPAETRGEQRRRARRKKERVTRTLRESSRRSRRAGRARAAAARCVTRNQLLLLHSPSPRDAAGPPPKTKCGARARAPYPKLKRKRPRARRRRRATQRGTRARITASRTQHTNTAIRRAARRAARGALKQRRERAGAQPRTITVARPKRAAPPPTAPPPPHYPTCAQEKQQH